LTKSRGFQSNYLNLTFSNSIEKATKGILSLAQLYEISEFSGLNH